MSLPVTNFENYTLDELYDFLFSEEERYYQLLDEPVMYYESGNLFTYMSAMSQVYAQEACKNQIKDIRDEIKKRKESSK